MPDTLLRLILSGYPLHLKYARVIYILFLGQKLFIINIPHWNRKTVTLLIKGFDLLVRNLF